MQMFKEKPTLSSLLARWRLSLADWMQREGLTTQEDLNQRCAFLGVQAPTLSQKEEPVVVVTQSDAVAEAPTVPPPRFKRTSSARKTEPTVTEPTAAVTEGDVAS